MIKRGTNEIVNGFGTVSVGNNGCDTLILSHIAPPKEVGANILDEVDVLDTVILEMNKEERDNLIKSLLNIKEENFKVNFNGWTLDFSEYNKKSIDVYIKHLNKLKFISLSMAC